MTVIIVLMQARLQVLAATIPAIHRHQLHQQQNLQRTSWHGKRSVAAYKPEEIPWHNPCGGFYVEKNPTEKLPPRKETLNNLRIELRNAYSLSIRGHSINIKNMTTWNKSRKDYKFLPTLNPNKTKIALRVWHKNMQVYVASFHYLYMAKSNWDHNKSSNDDKISNELKTLLQRAKSNLCGIETALNKTMRIGRKITSIPKTKMQKKLRSFVIKLQPIYEREVNEQRKLDIELDLKMLKHRYFAYVRAMLKNLRAQTKPGTGAKQSKTTKTLPQVGAQENHEKIKRRKLKRIE